jgi:predicted ATP-dependent endonuclease of OLD family
MIQVQDKVEAASQRSMLSGTLAKHKIHDLSIAKAAQLKRKDTSGKIVQKYKEIYRHQARKDIKANDNDEKEVVNMQEQQLRKPWRAKYAKMIKTFKQDYLDV